eukprot:974786-Rhodomonas_salina.1
MEGGEQRGREEEGEREREGGRGGEGEEGREGEEEGERGGRPPLALVEDEEGGQSRGVVDAHASHHHTRVSTGSVHTPRTTNAHTSYHHIPCQYRRDAHAAYSHTLRHTLRQYRGIQ